MPQQYRNKYIGHVSPFPHHADINVWERLPDTQPSPQPVTWTASPVYRGDGYTPNSSVPGKAGNPNAGKIALFCIIVALCVPLVGGKLLATDYSRLQPAPGVRSAACTSYWSDRLFAAKLGVALDVTPGPMRQCAVARPDLLSARRQL